MNIVPIVKSVAGLASSLGAGAVVGNAIKATTPDNMKTVSKVFVGLGSVALSGIAGDMAARYVENQIQGIVDGIRVGKKLADVIVPDEPKPTPATPEETKDSE